MTAHSAHIGSILLATDLSVRSDRALDRAQQLTQANHTQLLALHVIELSLLDKLSEPAWPAAQAGYEQRADAWLLEDVAHLSVPVHTLVKTGQIVPTLLQVIKEHPCALVVMGQSHRDSFERLVRGSTVEQLAQQSDIPFLIVKKRVHQPYQHVVVASDFSEGSEQALIRALTLLHGARVTVFHAHTSQTHQNDLHAQAHQWIEQTCHAFGATAEGITVALAQGLPGASLHAYAYAQDVDVVVVGTHGATGLVRTAMGSVAQDILMHVACDVMVVRQAQSSANSTP